MKSAEINYYQHFNNKMVSVENLSGLPLINKYILGRSKLFFAEYNNASVYDTAPISYDLEAGTKFCIAHSKNIQNENEVLGGIAACIKSDKNIPIFKKYSSSYQAIKLIEGFSNDYKTAEIYGAWRSPTHSGLGITEELYKIMYNNLSNSGVELVAATLTPKNVEGYLRQAEANQNTYTTFIITGVSINVINTEGQTKPRLAIVSTNNSNLVEVFSRNNNFTHVSDYLKQIKNITDIIKSENPDTKISPANIITKLQCSSVVKPFAFIKQ